MPLECDQVEEKRSPLVGRWSVTVGGPPPISSHHGRSGGTSFVCVKWGSDHWLHVGEKGTGGGGVLDTPLGLF